MTRKHSRSGPAKTAAVFFPFDLFGSAGAARGTELLADAFREMLDDNQRERRRTRAQAYTREIHLNEIKFENLPAYEKWRQVGRQTVRKSFERDGFVLWIAGNHLGVLPVYEELAQNASDTLIIQCDAHLDIYNLSDCTRELSHGNFLLHAAAKLPAIINVGSRELLLTPEYIAGYYRQVIGAAELAVDAGAALAKIKAAAQSAARVFIDIDCDVFDPANFPAVSNTVPFGLTCEMLLRVLDAAWSEKVVGIAISEFDPARDVNDRCLGTLLWLIEFILLKRHEAPAPA